MVGARASRASRAGGDATLAWGIGNTVRLLIGVCARAPVIVPNAAQSQSWRSSRAACVGSSLTFLIM
jgi:hypothetical protein